MFAGFSPALCAGALLLAFGAAALPAQAQSGEDALRFAARYPAFNARMLGMGGAGTAGLADYQALVTNPAGLAYFQRSLIAGSLGASNVADDASYQSGRASGASTGADYRRTGLSDFAYVAKAPTRTGSLVFGASYVQSNAFDRELQFGGENGLNSITDFFMPRADEVDIDLGPGPDKISGTADDEYIPSFSRPLSFIAFETYGIDFDEALYNQNNAVPFLPAVTAGTVTQNGRVTEDGSMKEISFGGAAEGFQNVMIGLSANLVYGTYNFKRTFNEEDFQNANNGAGGTTDFDALTFEEFFESRLVGANVRAGVSTELARGFRLGVSVESPTFYSVNEEYGTALDTYFDNGDSYSYGRGADDTEGQGDFEYEITTPWRVGLGLAYSAGPVTVSGDAELVDWSQLRLKAGSDQSYFDNVNQSIRDNFIPVANVRLGLEYRLGPLALRTGLAAQPDPRDADNLGPDTVNRDVTYFSAGVGYRLGEQVQLDLGWMQGRTKDRYLPYAEVNDAPVVDEDIVRDRIALGLKVLF